MPKSLTLLIAGILVTGSALAAPVTDTPDLTKAGAASIDLTRGTYKLGPTGMRGWIHARAANNLDAVQGRSTLASRQILKPKDSLRSRCP
jgi:hypothetical protein